MAFGPGKAASLVGAPGRLPAKCTLVALLTLASLIAATSIGSAATTFKTLYEFKEGSDGDGPVSLIFDPSGALYGTTGWGGGTSCTWANHVVAGCGTVFKLTPPTASGGSWTETVLYRFTGGSDGAFPFPGVILDPSGALYGAANGGNSAACTGGCGVVFKLTPPAVAGGKWTESVLHSFAGGSDGVDPSDVIMDASGALYGTTSSGGDLSCGFTPGSGCGTVFKLAPPATMGGAWIKTTLHAFAGGTDGIGPYAGVILDASGALYGTTAGGGSKLGNGTVFKLTPPAVKGGVWTETILHRFIDGGSEGGALYDGLIFDLAGALYSTTFVSLEGSCGPRLSQCGNVFKLTPPASSGGAWTETTLYTFTGGSDGLHPDDVIFDASGGLFGPAELDGADKGDGTVFKLTPSAASGGRWTETTLHTFTGGGDGGGPNGSLLFDASGTLYGSAGYGGGTGCNIGFGADGCGTVFKLSGVATPLSKNPQTADFNADHKSDILWQNANGAVAVWEINGAKVTASGGAGNPGAGWRVVGAGYFWGSPHADILLQNLGGAVEIWQMNGWKKVASATVGAPAASWHAIGTGDFNGDGKSDILWQNANGAVAIWEMNGFKPIASAVLGNPGMGWRAIGAGDFNGDGKSDILLQNTNGAVAIWEMNGLKVLASATIGNPGTVWHVVGSGDFNRDGYADILFQNTNGAIAIWEMNGLKRIGGGTVGDPGTTCHVVGTGDYNGDGYSDILLQNANGAVEIWEMDGTKITASGSPGNPGPAWHAIGE